jgi:hypothetical protein
VKTSSKEGATCALCAAVLGGFDNCRAIFNAVLEREYSDQAYGESHLFTVDAYALQHSEEHGPRSNAFHLMRLCWLLEHGGNPSIRQVRKGGRAFYDARDETYREFPFLQPPISRGELTVVSVVNAQTPEEHAERARAWSQSVWDAWSEHHAWARKQVSKWFNSNLASGKSKAG